METIDTFLTKRKSAGLLRTLKPAQTRKNGIITTNDGQFYDFSSNDYLGLSDHPLLKQAAITATQKYATSSSASRLLSGDLKITHELEEHVAKLKGKQSALIFNTGYQANIGIISTLYDAEDAVFCDKLSHASILDGISLSGAKRFRFRHNDLDHLESQLKENADNFNKRLVVTESIFSMDGDRAPLKEIVELAERFGCEVMVDEAHATGVFGPDGAGVVAEKKLTDRVDFVMGTFSKALGSFGAYVAASKTVIDYLINTCRSFIYSTALPPAVIAANIAAIDLLKQEPFRRVRLLRVSAGFRDELAKAGFQVLGDSQIVPMIIGDVEKTVVLSEQLYREGFQVLPIRPPTVPAGQSRLRFSVTYHHDQKTLKKLVELIGMQADVQG